MTTQHNFQVGQAVHTAVSSKTAHQLWNGKNHVSTVRAETLVMLNERVTIKHTTDKGGVTELTVTCFKQLPTAKQARLARAACKWGVRHGLLQHATEQRVMVYSRNGSDQDNGYLSGKQVRCLVIDQSNVVS